MTEEKAWDGIWRNRRLYVLKAGVLFEEISSDIHFEEGWWYVYYHGKRYRAEKRAPRTYSIDIEKL